MSTDAKSGLWVESGGSGEELVLLLHGIGATAAVWRGVARELGARGLRWVAPDLRGHGRSLASGPFGFDQHAADLAALLVEEDSACVTVLGHSFGGAVGAVLASGRFGPAPARLITLGVKLQWSEDEIAGAHALAARPAKHFATRDEAMARYLKVSGLAGLVAPDAPETERGVTQDDEGWRLAMTPRVFEAVGPSMPDLLRASKSPLTITAGAEDPMVTLDAMKAVDPAALTLPGLPHNAQIVAPGRIADLVTG
jgi:pimeloyl-ACP methyl ester carboxylesterase